jgi:tight adherence protein B
MRPTAGRAATAPSVKLLTGSLLLLVTVLASVAIAAAVAIIAGVLRWTVRSSGRRQRDAAARRTLCAAVRMITADLEAGGRPAEVLSAAAEVVASPADSAAFAAAAAAAAAGRDVSPELAVAPRLAALGRAWELATYAGAPLSRVLAQVAADFDAQDARARDLAVALSGPRATAVLLAGLPVLGVVLGTALGARPLAFLIETHAGHAVLLLGVALDAVGVIWVERLIRRVER